MTNPAESLEFIIPPDSTATIEALAEPCGGDVFEYMGQAVVLGWEVAAQFQINQDNGCPTNLYFGSTEAGYEGFELPCSFEDPVPLSEPLLRADEELSQDKDSIVAVVPPEIAGLISEASQILGLSRVDFMQMALYFRWRYQHAYDNGGHVLIDYGLTETCLILDLGFEE